MAEQLSPVGNRCRSSIFGNSDCSIDKRVGEALPERAEIGWPQWREAFNHKKGGFDILTLILNTSKSPFGGGR